MRARRAGVTGCILCTRRAFGGGVDGVSYTGYPPLPCFLSELLDIGGSVYGAMTSSWPGGGGPVDVCRPKVCAVPYGAMLPAIEFIKGRERILER